MENEVTTKSEVEEIISTPASISESEVQKLDYNTALGKYNEAVKEQIIALSEQIDLVELEKVRDYGQNPLKRVFDESGAILKDEQGSSADQAVIRQIVDLSKQAHKSYEDLNEVLRNPNLIEKWFFKLKNKEKNKIIRDRAFTCFQLLDYLTRSINSWMDQLQRTLTQITTARSQYTIDCGELEKYIVAGRIAQDRIAIELEQLKEEVENGSIVEAEDRYYDLKDGYDMFENRLLMLEKLRGGGKLGIAELRLEERTNKTLQVEIKNQKDGLAFTAMQLSIAVLNAKNKEIVEGQKEITKLNDDLIAMNAKEIALTAQQAEEAFNKGIFTVEKALDAAKVVIDVTDKISKMAENRRDEAQRQVEKLQELIEEIEPYSTRENTSKLGQKSSDAKRITTSSNGGLTF